ncbi:MAG TPA: cytochrome c-type biogenesis protein [Rhizomicrobium sp.]|jgi:cytochrome c-type biogenesis protein CcmH|nr:cytochrome c-type biogenesis protein [Rhizomicrobium sp.]
MKTVIALLLMMVPALAAPTSSTAASTGATAMAGTFSDPALEARARNLQRQLRCLVCQGESIDESGSPFADDVRHLVRQEIAAGKSDQQIEDFLVARYGDFILMKPPLQSNTWLLWLAPFLVLAAGGTMAWVTVKKASSRSA